jgi:hypothetical protein
MSEKREPKRIVVDAVVEPKTQTVDQLLNKYGFSSGKPQVEMYKNLQKATSAYCQALVTSGFMPVEKDEKLTFVKGSFSVVVKSPTWEMFKSGKLIETCHYGKKSIDLARWHVKHS